MPGRNFKLGETRPVGGVFWRPKDPAMSTDPRDSRPHLLLHDCEDDNTPGPAAGIFATLAFMSRQDTEHTQYGAPAHRMLTPALQPLDPWKKGSFTLTSRFLMEDVRVLEEAANQASAADVRGCLISVRQGLGIGRGPALAGGRAIRGHLARIEGRVRDVTGLEYGIVVTDPTYSASRRYQALIPVIDLAELMDEGEDPAAFQPEDGELLVEHADKGWTAALPVGWSGILIDTVRLITLTEKWRKGRNPEKWLAKQITVLPYRVERDVLDGIDARLVRRLRLPVPAGSA
ncbi:MAG TPA: hypothetical protein VF584_20385 [Longimicrobium sp.]|jgi:hypothetical protein